MLKLELDSIRGALKVAADQVRALPDEELVRLALREAERTEEPPTKALREEIARKPRRQARATRPRAVRNAAPQRKPKAARIASEDLGLKTADGPSGKVLARLLETAPLTAVELAKFCKLNSKQVSNALGQLKRAGRVRIASGTRNNAMWVATARQTGARKPKATRPVSDDEEEGEGVQLVSTIPPPPALPTLVSPPPFSVVVESADAFDGTIDELRARAAEIVSTRGPTRWGDILDELRVSNRSSVANSALIGLLKSKKLFAIEGVAKDTLLTSDPPSVSAKTRLPTFEEGEGDRRDDCTHYRDCLNRWMKVSDSLRRLRDREPQARCPAACASYSATPQHVRMGLAMAGGRRGDA